MEMPPPPSDRTYPEFNACFAASTIAGSALILLDLFSGIIISGSAPAWSESVPLLTSLLPALALGGLAAFLPGPWRLLILAGACWWLGDSLSLGDYAQTLPLSRFWPAIAAATCLATCAILLRAWRRNLASAKSIARLLVLVGIVLYAAAAFTQRGRYSEVRTGVMVLVLAAFWLPTYLATWNRSRALLRLLALSGVVAGAAGTTTALMSPEQTEWSTRHTSASAPCVRQLRAWFVPALDEDSGQYVHRTVLGTPAARAASDIIAERLGKNRGVLFITIDAVRSDLRDRRVGGRTVLPHIDALAREGADFRRAYAPAPMTHFSVFGFLSGWYPSQFLSFRGGFESTPLITERLQSQGIETRGCYPRGMLIAGGNTFKRFDLGFESSSLHPWDDLTVEETFERVKPTRDGPWFSYVHVMLPHHPYDGASAEYRAGDSEFERYAAEAREADAFVEALRERFQEAGLADRMWTIIAADHGEEFGEHGAFRHSTQVYEESVRVPLVIHGPGVKKGLHVEPVSLIDLAPTLHHFFDLPVDRETLYAGFSWLVEATGVGVPARPRTVLVENPPRHLSRFNARASLVGRRWKLIADERARRLLLYDLEKDPDELKDVGAAHRETRDALWKELTGRRRFGGSGETLFETMESFTELLDEAAKKGPAGLFTYLEWMKGLSRDSELELLSCLAEYNDPLIPEKVAARYSGSQDPGFKLMVALINGTTRRPTDAQWNRLRTDVLAQGRGPLFHAFLAVAARWKLDAGAIDEDLTGLKQSDLLIRAVYDRVVLGKSVPSDLLRDALNSPSTRKQLLGLRASTGADLGQQIPRLIEIFESTTIAELRIEAARRLSEQDDDRAGRFLEKLAVQDDPGVAAIAAYGLARMGRTAPNLGRNLNLADTPDLVRADSHFWALSAKEVRLPLTLFPGGTRVALFLHFPFDGQRRIRVSAGSWSTIIAQTPIVPADPILLHIPAGTTSDTLLLAVETGSPGEFLTAGSLSIAHF